MPEDDRNLIVTVHYYSPHHFTHQGASWSEGSEAWTGTTWSGTTEEMRDVRHDFDLVADWAATNARPVFVGEFGAYSRADMNSRAWWTAFVARQAEDRGMSWAYWEFCAGFGVYDPERRAWRPMLLNALVPPRR